jgi:hypothetical protein
MHEIGQRPELMMFSCTLLAMHWLLTAIIAVSAFWAGKIRAVYLITRAQKEGRVTIEVPKS